MAKQKLRKTAKNLKSIPKFKKKLAQFLAKTQDLGTIDIQNILVHGHRGLLAMSEEQLTNRFDKYLEGANDTLQYYIDERAIKIERKEREYQIWETDKEIAKIKALIKEAESISDDIFEQIALVE